MIKRLSPPSALAKLASLLILAGGLGLASLPAATFPSTTVPLSLGVNCGNNTHNNLNATDYTQMTQAGVNYIRLDLYWGNVETVKGTRNYSSYVNFVNTALANGKKVVLILDYDNHHYRVAPDTTVQIDTQHERDGFAAYAAGAAATFTQPGVIFEIWNEPNDDHFWPTHNADNYMALVNATVPAMKAANPNCTVVSGGINSFNWLQSFNWLKRCMELGLHTKVDGIGVHLYGNAENAKPERALQDIQDIRNMVQRHGGPANFPVLNTEFGAQAGEFGGTAAEKEMRRAEVMTRMYLVTLMADVKLNSWYHWKWDDGHSIVTSSNVPKTIHAAAAVLNTQLAGYTFEQRVNVASSHDYVAVFKNGVNRKLVVWSSLSTAHNVVIPTTLASGSFTTASMLGAAGSASVSGNNITVSATGAPTFVTLGTANVSSVPNVDVLNDTFTDGGTGQGADPRDGAWDASYGLSLSTAAFAASGNTTPAMVFNVNGSPSEGWQTSRSFFESQDLEVGESLTLTLDFRLTGSIPNNGGMIRFALGTIMDNYALCFGSGTVAGGTFNVFPYESVSGTATNLATTGTPVAISNQLPHTFQLKVTRTAATTLSLEGKVDSNTFTATRTGVNSFGFNRVRLGVGDVRNINMDFHFDNIRVVRNGALTNLAPLGTISGFSSEQSTARASEAIDNSVASGEGWSSNVGGYPQWIEVNLGSNCTISATEFVQTRDYRFRVEAKPTGGVYTTVVNRTANTQAGPHLDNFAPVTAQFVKLTITGAATYTGNWVTLHEFRIFGIPGGTPPAGIQILPEADSYVRNGTYSTTNYGTDTFLNVKNDGTSYARQTLIRFNLSAITNPAGLAVLKLPVTSGGAAVTSTNFEVKLVANDAWGEGTLTWDTKPPGSTVLGSFVGASSGVISVPITSAVNAERAGDGKITVIIHGLNAGTDRNIAFGSKENATPSLRPYLDVQ